MANRPIPQREYFFMIKTFIPLLCLSTLAVGWWWQAGLGSEPDAPKQVQETAAERGYRILRTKAFLPPDVDEEVVAELWKTWPEEQREQARQASPEQRRKMTFSYYGLIEADDEYGDSPLGYVDTQDGWVMNCLACHGGKVMGKTHPGLPNSHYALETFTADIRTTKVRMGKPLGHMDLGSLVVPLGTTNGTTNAVVFGLGLLAKRDQDLNVVQRFSVQHYQHHDLDAPPFWHVKKKTHLYYDAAVPKNHRALTQFVLIPQTSGKTVRSWEDDFKDVLAWIESVEAPQYPGPIDEPLAQRGKVLFHRHCAECHGTYGENPTYPNRVVDIAELGTDPVRLKSISPAERRHYEQSWLANYGEDDIIEEPVGYIAPPLDGIWASAPYLHNGSVPTLWHLFHPEKRPVVWKRSENGYDHQRMGLEVETFEELPRNLSYAQRHRYFDTTKQSKSAAGHRYPEVLDESEKTAVLEYLKTL